MQFMLKLGFVSSHSRFIPKEQKLLSRHPEPERDSFILIKETNQLIKVQNCLYSDRASKHRPALVALYE